MIPTATTASRLDGTAFKVARRYEDAYRVARILVFIGKLMRIAGVLFAVLVFLGGMLAANSVNAFRGNEGARALVVCVAAAALSLVFMWVLGMFISAMGQQTLAALDTAVNTSPFLTNEQRAAMIDVE